MNPVNFSKSSVAMAVTTDIVSSINKGTQKISAFHGNPDIVLALTELESDITIKLPETDKFTSLVKKILSLTTYEAMDLLLDVAIDGSDKYSKKEQFAAMNIFNRLGPVSLANSVLTYQLRRQSNSSI